MSYLPRMSKTYKEPKELFIDDHEDTLTSYSIKPASSLLNEKTYNPQMALRQYRYIPHAPPVLPGPSVLDEVLENELFQESSRLRRSISKMETISKTSDNVPEEVSREPSEATVDDIPQKPGTSEKTKRVLSRKGSKSSKSNVGKRRSSKTVKKDLSVNLCLAMNEKPFTALGTESETQNPSENSGFLSKGELDLLKREKTAGTVCREETRVKTPKTTQKKPEKPKTEHKSITNRSVQCTIFGSPTKMFVIPPIINSLLRTLAFLLQEIKKEESSISSRGKKFPMTQIQLILGDLCNQKVEKEYGFDVTYSDSKRLEIIFGELQKYMKDVYGDRGEYIDKMEDLRRVFTELKSKEMELCVLSQKLQEAEESSKEEFLVRDEDLKCPEITLQNKRLESEQLFAEVEFSSRELKKYQKTIAELEWDIKAHQEQVIALKKSAGSKSRTEVLGRKSSIHRFSSDVLSKIGRPKEGDGVCKKKT